MTAKMSNFLLLFFFNATFCLLAYIDSRCTNVKIQFHETLEYYFGHTNSMKHIVNHFCFLRFFFFSFSFSSNSMTRKAFYVYSSKVTKLSIELVSFNASFLCVSLLYAAPTSLINFEMSDRREPKWISL